MPNITTSRRRGVCTTITVDQKVLEWLRARNGGKHTIGRAIDALVHEEMGRREERERLREKVLAVFLADEAPHP